jgi:uncharacterized protein YndB with AHSA1/START domain
MRSTRMSMVIHAPRERVYQALLDRDAIQQWRVPTGMSAVVHEFEPREDGRIRVSLQYNVPTTAGKTTAQMDTYHGRFVELVPFEKVVERLEFETEDPELQGEMTMTIVLTDAEDGTCIDALHEGLPRGLSSEENSQGWSQALEKLAALVESGEPN